jgi:hypothetical protein
MTNLSSILGLPLAFPDLFANLPNCWRYFFVSVVPDNGFDTHNVLFVVEMNVQVRGNSSTSRHTAIINGSSPLTPPYNRCVEHRIRSSRMQAIHSEITRIDT